MDINDLHLILNYDKAHRVYGKPVLSIYDRIAIHRKIAFHDFPVKKKTIDKWMKVLNKAKTNGYVPLLFQISTKTGDEYFMAGKTKKPATPENISQFLNPKS